MIGLLYACLLTAAGVSTITREDDRAAGLVMLTLALLGLLCTWRVTRAGVRTDEHGILVVNPIRTQQFPWAAVERFSVGTHGMSARKGIVHLCDGSTVGMWAVQGPGTPEGRPEDRTAEGEIEQLNALLVEHTDGKRQ